MPFSLSALMPARANRSASRSPTSSSGQRKLYFPPGGTHDRHTVPPDRLQISFSDPVLVAAEQRLSNIPNELRQGKPPIIKDPGARQTAHPDHLGPVVFHLKAGVLSPRSGDYHDGPLAPKAVNPLAKATDTHGTSSGHFWNNRLHGAGAQSPSLLDPSDDSCDITEVVTIMSVIDDSPDNADNSASENRRYGSDLAPLASETFKEELYIRGYLKKPASRPTNIVARKPSAGLVFVSRKVFPKVLGRREGHKVAECLRAEQDAAETSSSPDTDTHLSEKQVSTSVTSVTLRAPHADNLESPGTDTNISASESFDLHEFSYITAFTTPPSSPSIVVDAETFKKGAKLGDSKYDEELYHDARVRRSGDVSVRRGATTTFM